MSNFSLDMYKTFVFDCDGVLLDSNKVKTEAFFQAALPFGLSAAQSLVEYHVSNGGVSRYKKFEYFLEKILSKSVEQTTANLEDLLLAYARNVREGLLSCEIASHLDELRIETTNCRWLIVSGGDQEELREILEMRGIAKFFDGGIFGSPDSKDVILPRELANDNIQLPALFIGDSKYDYQAASAAGLDFVFLSGWSEVADWQTWVIENNLLNFGNLHGLLETHHIDKGQSV